MISYNAICQRPAHLNAAALGWASPRFALHVHRVARILKTYRNAAGLRAAALDFAN